MRSGSIRPRWDCWAGPLPRFLRPAQLVVAEHARKQTLDDRYGSLKRMRQLKQGDAVLSFYELVR